MKRVVWLAALAVLGLVCNLGVHAQPAAGKPAASTPIPSSGSSATKARQLSLAIKPWKGDFDGMLERHVIRVYVPYSRTIYFVDKGRERGAAADLMRQFERWVNKKYAKALGKPKKALRLPRLMMVLPAASPGSGLRLWA